MLSCRPLQRSQFTIPAALAEARLRRHNWGPKKSVGVTAKKLSASVGASETPAGIPVEASVAFEFSASTNFGALLLCPDKVLQSSIDTTTASPTLLPVLHVADEMEHYGIADPYGKSNEYYKDHYVCLWDSTC